MKNIVLTIPQLSIVGGMEGYFLMLADGLTEIGYAVHIVVTDATGDGYEAARIRFRCYDLSAHVSAWSRIKSLAKLVNELNASFLINNFSRIAQYALPLIASSTRALCVVHSDDPRFYASSAICKEFVWRWVAPSPRVKVKAEESVGDSHSDRVRLVPHGIDPKRFNMVAQYKLDQSRKMIFVGSFLPHKGVDLLPEIFAKVALQVSGVELTIIGDGASREGVAARFHDLGVSSQVKWLGRLNPSEIPGHLRDKDVLLLPTRVESFGLVIVEAMMCGVVPVVTRLPGITDFIISENETGMLADIDCCDSFVECVVRLYLDKQLWFKCRTSGLEDTARRFTVERMLTDYERIFSEGPLCDNKPSLHFLAARFRVARALYLELRCQTGWWRRGVRMFEREILTKLKF